MSKSLGTQTRYSDLQQTDLDMLETLQPRSDHFMIENFRSELIWKVIKKCPCIVNGLRLAGFSGGWLSSIK